MARWNAALHPRDRLGRFAPKYVPGSVERNTRVGRGGQYVGVKTGAEFRVGTKGRQVLVKAIVGYKGPDKPPATRPPTGGGAPSGTKATTRQTSTVRTKARPSRRPKSGRKVAK
jgi:hypothetical protein